MGSLGMRSLSLKEVNSSDANSGGTSALIGGKIPLSSQNPGYAHH